MNEQEAVNEIEQMRRELAELREERDCLHKMVCKILPFEEIQLTEDDLRQMRETAVTFEELMGFPAKTIRQQIPLDSSEQQTSVDS